MKGKYPIRGRQIKKSWGKGSRSGKFSFPNEEKLGRAGIQGKGGGCRLKVRYPAFNFCSKKGEEPKGRTKRGGKEGKASRKSVES